MNNKVYTLNVDEKELKGSGSKSKAVTKNKAQSVIENYGIVEINNSSSKKRVKNLVDKGYSKTVCSKSKKTVKKSTLKPQDYFDFDFRYNVNSEENSSKISRAVKKNNAAKSTEEKINVALNALLGSFEQNVTDIATVTDIAETEIQAVSESAEACANFVLDDAAMHIIDIARLGSLFG